MGSFSGWSTRSEVIKECLNLSAGYKLVAHCCVGNCLWYVYEKALEGNKFERSIGLCVISVYGPRNNREWGYKPMNEVEHPYYYNCPLSYLELALPMRDDKGARGWREAVKEFWKQKKDGAELAKKLKAGENIKSKTTNKTYTFLSDYSRGFILAQDDNGKNWRIKKDDIEVVTAKERLEYLRGELKAERISFGELAELQSLIPHIEDGDVELLEAAGVPEEAFRAGSKAILSWFEGFRS